MCPPTTPALTGALVTQFVGHSRAPAASSTYRTGAGARLAAWTGQPGHTGTQLDPNVDLVDASPQCAG